MKSQTPVLNSLVFYKLKLIDYILPLLINKFDITNVAILFLVYCQILKCHYSGTIKKYDFLHLINMLYKVITFKPVAAVRSEISLTNVQC